MFICDDCAKASQPAHLECRAGMVVQKLSPTQRAHVHYDIAGATQRTLSSLERLGLIEDAPERPGYVMLSVLGSACRDILVGP